jgi:hypothetical protein
MRQLVRAAAQVTLASIFTFLPASARSQTPSALTLGEQRTLVMLVNFQDNTSQPYTTAYAHDIVFRSVSDFYLENSSGQTWLSGDVAGWFTLPMSASVCDTTLLSQLANQAASDAGFSVTSYSRYVYGFPGSPCGWAGFAASGSLPTRAWIGGSFPFNVVAHEVGHTFGLGHAGAMHCDGGPLGDPCTSGELADPLDVMASLGQGHFNAFHKERLGWLNYGVSPSITTVQGSGTFAIDPLESVVPGTKALKILKAADQATGYRTWYYVEVRRALGFDTYLPGGTNALGGVLVRIVSEPGATSYLVDMTSGTRQYQDSALLVGQTFSDDQAGISITPLSVSDAGATIAVTLGPGACNPGTPTLKLTPSQSSAVASGSTVSYTLTLTNSDSSSCGSSTFGLRAAVPSGWSGVFATPSLPVAAGSSASTTLQVISASSATAGTYSFTTQATDASRTASASGAYTVAAPLTISASTGSATYPLGSDAVMAASVYKGGLPVSGATVTFKITPPGGKATSAKTVTDANGAATYVLSLRRKAAAGTYSILAAVSTGGSTASATTTFKVY